MTEEELRNAVAPFQVIYSGPGKREKPITVTGFSEHDPLGVGEAFGGHATAYFEGGGWLLVSDLVKHYEIVRPEKNAEGKTE